MAFKWKPNASQKREYSERMKEKDRLPIIKTVAALRTGCKIKYYSTNEGEILMGEIFKHSYGVERYQHTFTVLLDNGEKKLVKGRNLYPNLLEHIQGEESLKLNK